MSRVYLVRHGQAGSRQNYDTLSELGILQAQRLGAWFQQEGIVFDHVLSGGLSRQIQTARHAAREPEIEPRLAEFDLDAVYRGLAPKLYADNPEFAREYDALKAAVQSPDAPQHRQWTTTDVAVFRAWVEERYSFDGESWPHFKARVRAAMDVTARVDAGGHLAIFTSATPIGLWLAALLDANDENAMKLAGACYNASVTTLRVQQGDVRLISFNAIPHLDQPMLRTFR
ncbi:MAG: histidine phosphatase family protein [Acidobacteria bacterium]|nr:histidine phosphatase family protein [Acidobacteriota bacterium]